MNQVLTLIENGFNVYIIKSHHQGTEQTVLNAFISRSAYISSPEKETIDRIERLLKNKHNPSYRYSSPYIPVSQDTFEYLASMTWPHKKLIKNKLDEYKREPENTTDQVYPD